MFRILTILITLACLAACSDHDPLMISVVSTNDVHGQLLQKGDRGGLVTISGYVNAVRNVRANDGGAVLLIDAGDMWQGTLESNLSEGAAMISAYNALGYNAAAIGNHEFDFGPEGPAATPSEPGHDPRGALKRRAAEAEFPILAANLTDLQTGKLVDWENVRPSILIDVNGIKVGIVGVTTKRAFQRTIALNVGGLEITPLVPAIEEQAKALRADGATLVIVAAHAGGQCTRFEDPADLSSCNENSEIFRVARELPTGLVDYIVAGHVHQGLAHVVNGTAITSSYSSTRAFSRVDFSIDRKSGEILERKIFPPHLAVADAEYEGQPVEADAAVVAIAAEAKRQAKLAREAKVGIHLETAFTLNGNPESSLGNLFTDALLESVDVDIVIQNIAGGLRTGLPAGELEFGDVYEVSPFENRIVIVDLSGADLRQVVAEQAHRKGLSMGFSGMTVYVACENQVKSVDIVLADGREVSDTDRLTIALSDYLATGGDGVFTNVMPDGGYPVDHSKPLIRDKFVEWLAERSGSINAREFSTAENPKWNRPDDLDPECRLPN